MKGFVAAMLPAFSTACSWGLESAMVAESLEQRRGFTVGDFLRRFEREKALLEKGIAVFHYAQRLFAQRDSGSSGLFDAPLPRKDSHF